MAGFMTYWSKEYIKRLKQAGDHEKLSVIFGSHHTVMPSISSVKVGDVIYPVTLADGAFVVMAKLPVEKIEVAFEYLVRETGQIHHALVPDGFAIEHEYSSQSGRAGEVFYLTNIRAKFNHKSELPEGTKILILREMAAKPHLFHQEPQSCCAAVAASGTQGSTISMRPMPVEVLPTLRFGPDKSKEKPLKLNKNNVPIISSLSGFLRRMNTDTQEIFERAFLYER